MTLLFLSLNSKIRPTHRSDISDDITNTTTFNEYIAYNIFDIFNVFNVFNMFGMFDTFDISGVSGILYIFDVFIIFGSVTNAANAFISPDTFCISDICDMFNAFGSATAVIRFGDLYCYRMIHLFQAKQMQSLLI